MEFTKVKKTINLWAPVFVWALFIFSFSSLPANPVTEIHWKDFLFKKSLHITFYGILTVLIYRSFRQSKVAKKTAAVYSVLFTILYGVSDEFHQSLTPGRDPQMRDVIFDTLGRVLTVYLLWKVLPKMHPKIRKLAKNFQLE